VAASHVFRRVVALFLGWWLLLDFTLLLFMAFLFFLWFHLVVIRFEEKELKALTEKNMKITSAQCRNFSHR
jgi:protein-S-isoprenylcysteine O-methyltransferase Ste14